MQGEPPKRDHTAARQSSAAKPKSRRRWLQFSLSTLLLATAGFALWLGLWVDRARRQQRAVKTILAAGQNIVFYEHEFDSSGRLRRGAEPSGPAWLRRLLGDEYFVSVQEVQLNDPSDAELRLLRDLPRLRRLRVGGSRITDEGLAHLGQLSALRELGIRAPGVTDAGVADLKGLKNLERLSLWAMPVSDAGVVQLVGLTQLRELDLEETHVTARGAAKLQEALPDLEIAPVSFLPSVPEEKNAVAELIKMGAYFDADEDGRIYRVRFDGPHFTDNELAVLKEFTGLKELLLSRTRVTAEGVKTLQERCRDLEVFPRLWAPVPDEAQAVAALKKLGANLSVRKGQKVEAAELRNPEVTDADLVHLRALPHLKLLEIDATRLTDAGLEHLAGLANLEDLQIGHGPITDAGLVHLKAMTRLKSLALYKTEITGPGLSHLSSLANLESVDLTGNPVAGEGLGHLAALPNLKTLWLDATPVGDKDLARVGECRSLETLSLQNTAITDAGLPYLAKLTNLKKLFLAGSRVSKEGKERLQGLLPNAKILP